MAYPNNRASDIEQYFLWDESVDGVPNRLETFLAGMAAARAQVKPHCPECHAADVEDRVADCLGFPPRDSYKTAERKDAGGRESTIDPT